MIDASMLHYKYDVMLYMSDMFWHLPAYPIIPETSFEDTIFACLFASSLSVFLPAFVAGAAKPGQADLPAQLHNTRKEQHRMSREGRVAHSCMNGRIDGKAIAEKQPRLRAESKR